MTYIREDLWILPHHFHGFSALGRVKLFVDPPMVGVQLMLPNGDDGRAYLNRAASSLDCMFFCRGVRSVEIS